MPDVNSLHQSTANWRETMAKNKRRTVGVMCTYVLIYVLLGLACDVYIDTQIYPHLSLHAIFSAIASFQFVPLVTFLMLGVAVISLIVALIFSDKLMLLGTKYYLVTPDTMKDPDEIQLYNVVEEMKVAAGMRFMPKVYIIDADYMNAFASGWSEKSAMVAITRGLMTKLTRSELQAVMAHELTHIRHQDIKLTVCASVLSQLILMVIDVIFYSSLFGSDRRGSRSSGGWFFLIVLILRIVLPLLTMCLMLYLSRRREFMADAGAVELMRDNQPMASALCKIAKDHQENLEQYTRDYRKTGHEQVRRQAYIYDPASAGIKSNASFSDALSSHPLLQKRLDALGFKTDAVVSS